MVERGWVADGFSTGLRMVTTRVTTMGLVAPALSDVGVAEDRPAFFAALDLEKNEESDAEGRTIASDIIMDWAEGRSPETELYPDMITGHGISGPPFLSHFLVLLSRFPKFIEDGKRRWGRRRAQEGEEIQEEKR